MLAAESRLDGQVPSHFGAAFGCRLGIRLVVFNAQTKEQHLEVSPGM